VIYISKNKTGIGYKKLLTIHKQGDSYNDVKDDKSRNITIRTDVLNELLNEQNNLCAYCMKEISIKNAQIEHIIGQSYIDKNNKAIGKIEDTNYDNMLAVCRGNSCGNSSHCDASRSNYQPTRPLLFISPLNKIQMNDIYFSQNGSICYKEPLPEEKLKELENKNDYKNLDEDTNINYDLNIVLKLNCSSIREKRKRILSAIKKILFKNNKLNKKLAKTYVQAFNTKNHLYNSFCQKNGEFSQVAIFTLKKYI
jgi:uncharacterized protein (TIGR02646 family)